MNKLMLIRKISHSDHPFHWGWNTGVLFFPWVGSLSSLPPREVSWIHRWIAENGTGIVHLYKGMCYSHLFPFFCFKTTSSSKKYLCKAKKRWRVDPQFFCGDTGRCSAGENPGRSGHRGYPQDTTWTGPGSVLGSRHYAVAGFFAGCPVQSSDPLNDVLWCFFLTEKPCFS